MEIYLKLFEVLFPVFFVVGIGYYLGKNNSKIDTTFITNFAANIGTPAMIIYALNPANISFDIFKNYFWYYLIAIVCFFFVVGIGYYLGKKNPKIDTTFITNFAANVGTPAMIIYALNPVNISFNIFIN